MTLSAATLTRLEKTATDNGFDQSFPRQGSWLAFASTQTPLRLWLSAGGDDQFLAALSRKDVALALIDHGTVAAVSLPQEAYAARAVADMPSLHRLVRRAFQLSKTLPDELLHAFERQASALPRSTEAERLLVQRVGQDIFRAGLIEYWEGRCAITTLGIVDLLRAGHIKPWADCATDAERLDVFNGFLLAPHLDATFDRGFITVEDGGKVVVSPLVSSSNRRVLGLDTELSVRGLTDGHRLYLQWHRRTVFKGGPAAL
jgi:putative restriction endonuclease